MPNDNATPQQLPPTVLVRGCLAGLLLAFGFLAISGLTFLLLSALGLPPNLTLLITIFSGPMIGGIGVIALLISGRLLPLLGLPLADDNSER